MRSQIDRIERLSTENSSLPTHCSPCLNTLVHPLLHLINCHFLQEASQTPPPEVLNHTVDLSA